MKNITIFRKDDFWGRGINVKILLNDVSYDLPNSSKIQIESDMSEITLKAKYLWYTSKKINLNSSDAILNIRVKQIFTNSQLLISILALIGTFTIHYFYSSIYFEYLFKIIGISFLSYIFFFLTVGFKNYFTFTINEEL